MPGSGSEGRADAGRHRVTVDEGIAPPVSASEPCMRVSTSHGSSVIRPWSWAPLRAGDLHVGASPSRVIQTSLDGVLTASAALLVPLTDRSPSPRQPIHERSPRPWLLGESPPVAHPVDTSSSLRAIRDDAVPHLRLLLTVGPHAAPGVSGVSLSRLQNRSALILALLAVANHPRRLLPRHDDSAMGSAAACPSSARLDGIPGRMPRDRH